MTDKNSHSLVSYQPLRLLFQLSHVFLGILRLPYYATISLVPFLRPNRNWGVKQTFMTQLVRSLLHVSARVGITQTLSLDPGKEGKRFQIIPASAPEVYKGPLASGSTKPAKTGGTWFPDSPGVDVASKVVVLYFHGGAYVQNDGRTGDCAATASYFLKKGSADFMFSLQYRLSGRQGLNPFPAALQDALSSYLFLLHQLHVPAKNIILAGDSAGGNLAVALLRYLHEFESESQISRPKCAVLLSPWVDPFDLDLTNIPQRHTDYIPASFPSWGAHAYADGCPDPQTNPYITPLGHPFQTPVPIFVNVGTAEVLLRDIMQWALEMRGVKGNAVELHSEEDAVHDTFLTAQLMGFEDSAWNVAAKVADFVKKY
ncbi:hypothetical protein HIM_00732 [Hirsutella minnesotensis 3608]|nr:hypothetical protein HIM_00732 [Hirsutella minnesotensis 3608]